MLKHFFTNQDLEGGDIFAYYHPQDLSYLKEVYEAIMAEQVRALSIMILIHYYSLVILNY